ncbi:MAG: isoleucine--tRNA ligase [Thermodesulfobacteriota bacterium]
MTEKTTDYKATLNLPQTDFKMKANLAQREPEFLKQWDEQNLYATVQQATAGRPLYVLHDGPPYANGRTHMGHALNKILKDVILKSKRMAGHHCPYVPGWDCHGLPIELNVDKELGSRKREIPKIAFRDACRKYAAKWITIQKEEFKRLGVLGDWEHPYLTIDYKYEAAIAREFNRFLLSGAVTRSKKPVHWCSSCQTALAEAEVEYADHSSPSIYVKFPVADDLRAELPALSGKKVAALIWTTTPWTLPANLAVAFHPDYDYVAVESKGEVLLMAQGLLDRVVQECGLTEYEIIATFSARILEGKKCRHPFLERESLIILADYVTLDAGTGCVHTAPGHGREDYLSGVRYGLPILSPVAADGRFTDEAGPYAGMFTWEANKVINADLTASGFLLKEGKVSHSYPHCWRCKKPVAFRATEQWFISMEQNGLRHKALAEIKQVAWIPKWGMERIYGMVEGRPDWCLSRQRAWGVPLTVAYCAKCGEIKNDEQVMVKITTLFEQEGADAWYSHPLSDFIGTDATCAKCGGKEFVKEEDILDVWFDSGVSYAAVLEERDELAAPADLYLEGSDQHRGWFQSSLLAAVGTRGHAPYKGVLTHGFVVDGQGKKMSKSIGNVIAPETIIKNYGAEILRLWAASEDYRDDIKISDDILKQLADAYRKIRNTVRFMLGNLYDFHPATDRVDDAAMGELDRWALAQFELLKKRILAAYESFEFHLVYHSLSQFCTVTLSSLYLDILKDRLYVLPAASPERRAAQTVFYEITEGLLRLMAPVLSFLSAEAWEFLPRDPARPALVFTALFPEVKEGRLQDEELIRRWEQLLKVRGELTRALEIARRDKVIGHSLEAVVTVAAEGELAAFLEANHKTLLDIAIVSDLRRTGALADVTNMTYVTYASEEIPGLQVAVAAATGQKCERCWIRSESVGSDAARPGLCGRCAPVVAAL